MNINVELKLQTTRLLALNSLTKLATQIYTYSGWRGGKGSTWPEGRGLMTAVEEGGMENLSLGMHLLGRQVGLVNKHYVGLDSAASRRLG